MSSIIERCTVHVLEHPVKLAVGPAAVSYSARGCVLVELRDGDGHVGWGETYLDPGVAATTTELGTALVGSDARSGRRILDGVVELGAGGCAVSALAIALDDLRGRELGLSVSELYGGALRTSVRAYASSGGYRNGVSPEESFASDVQEAVTDGFSAVKLRIGRYHPNRELPILERIRAETDPGIELMVDANGAYSVPRALEVGRALSRFGYRWYEEPLIRFRAGMSYPGYEQLASLDIPIAAGEGLQCRSAFHDFLHRGAADIVQPDVGICGGIGEGRFIGELAALHGRPCIPHAWGGAVMLAATLHLLAILPEPSELAGIDSPLLEYDRFENRMRTELTDGNFEVCDGQVAVPHGPGLGVDVDLDRLAALARR